jgi:hypothetical protein
VPGHHVRQAAVRLAELQERAERGRVEAAEVRPGDPRLRPQALDELVGLPPLSLECGERAGVAGQAREPVAVRLVIRHQHDVVLVGRREHLLDLGLHIALVLRVAGPLVREVAVHVGHVDVDIPAAAADERLDDLKRVRPRMLLAVLRLRVRGLQPHALDQVVARHALVVDPVQAPRRATADLPRGGTQIHYEVIRGGGGTSRRRGRTEKQSRRGQNDRRRTGQMFSHRLSRSRTERRR